MKQGAAATLYFEPGGVSVPIPFSNMNGLCPFTNIRAESAAESCGVTNRIRIIPHEAVPRCGTFEFRFPDGRPSLYFCWDDIPGRRLRPDLADSDTAKKIAQALARAEHDKLPDK